MHALAARARAALPAACVRSTAAPTSRWPPAPTACTCRPTAYRSLRLRERFGAALVLGQSTHRVAEVEAARDAGADYVTFGPVFATPSKAAYGEPVGLAALRDAAAVGIPVSRSAG